jgi:hypothetical protein
MTGYIVALNGEYEALGQCITKIAAAKQQSKSNVIRDALCTYYGFTPAKSAKVYSKKYM